jgi:hypothetical protein
MALSKTERHIALSRLVCFATLWLAVPLPAAERLRVSDNKRFLVHEDGRPFFWLGDTAWELFHRLDREKADLYLRTRAAQRFTIIQAVALAELDGLNTPNAYGHRPLRDNDPTRPNDAYFEHVDWIVRRAAELGLWIGMLPTWGDKVVEKKWGVGPEVFTPENAAAFGEYLGRRYRDDPIVWILGGDRPADSPAKLSIWKAMAAGLRRGDGGSHLVTYHPSGGPPETSGSSSFFPNDDPTLDFNMRQSGHGDDTPTWERIAADHARAPPKPVLDGEPIYEDHPVHFKAKERGYSNAADVRRFLYWDLFAGAFGHTYGNHCVWQMWEPGRQPVNGPPMPWFDAIRRPGAEDMQHGRALLESRPFLERVPAPDLIVSETVDTAVPGAGIRRMAATRSADGSYAFVYTPAGRSFEVRLDLLSGERLRAWWFDPRTGVAEEAGELPRSGVRRFEPPAPGEMLDWVLVLDDASRNFSAPGAAAWRDTSGLAGHRLLVTSTRTGDTEIFLADPASGDLRNVTRSPSSEDRYPCWSPDGTKIAFTSNRDGAFDVYVSDAAGGPALRLTHFGSMFGNLVTPYAPSWQGERIVFGLYDPNPRMGSMRPDGSDRIYLGEGHDPCLSADGRRIVFTGRVDGGVSVFTMDADGSNRRRVVEGSSRVGAVFPCWSPDGKEIAYSFPDGEALELFVVSAEGSAPRQVTRLGRISTPCAWSPDGAWLSFRSTDEAYWRDPARMEKVYAEKPGDKRPVWVVRPDGSGARIIECLRFQCAMDGSRAAWRPVPRP